VHALLCQYFDFSSKADIVKRKKGILNTKTVTKNKKQNRKKWQKNKGVRLVTELQIGFFSSEKFLKTKTRPKGRCSKNLIFWKLSQYKFSRLSDNRHHSKSLPFHTFLVIFLTW
jgi:hypothetical protein